MTIVEILNLIDRIYLWVDSLEGTELGDVLDQIRQITKALDALRDNVEDALQEKEYEIGYLKEALENLQDKVELARMEGNRSCLSNCR